MRGCIPSVRTSVHVIDRMRTVPTVNVESKRCSSRLEKRDPKVAYS